MIRGVIAIVILASGIAIAVAAPMIPFGGGVGGGDMVPGYGPLVPGNGLMVPNTFTGGSFPPPPVCSNKLDFTQACNSQYVGIF